MERKIKEKRGITLIALVVTIVVLLILAGITINMLFGNGGIFNTAGDAANAWNEATINEQESLQNTAEQIGNLVNGQVGGNTPTDPVDIATLSEIVEKEEGEKAKDNLGNIVTVPKGFKVVTSEGTTVPEGIVIEDANQNQFVWIPVGTVHKDSNPENDVTIQLGRYTFNTSNGTPTPVQLAYTEENPTNYINEVGTNKDIIDTYYTEISTPREGYASTEKNGLNATAKNLAKFVEKTKENGGYYLARYEASYGSGYNSAGSTDTEKYANANRDTTGNSSLMNTGETEDEKCNIFDMAANVREWTTEYSTRTDYALHCTFRGGYYSRSDFYTANRLNNYATYSYDHIGFRVVLYTK